MPRNRELEVQRARLIEKEFYRNNLGFVVIDKEGREILRILGFLESAGGLGSVLKVSARVSYRKEQGDKQKAAELGLLGEGDSQTLFSVITGGAKANKESKFNHAIQIVLKDLKAILEGVFSVYVQDREGGKEGVLDWQEDFIKAGYFVISLYR